MGLLHTRHRRDTVIARLFAAAALVVAMLAVGYWSSAGSASPRPAAKAKKAPKDFFGMVRGPSADASDYATMESAGVETVRIPISWAAVQADAGKTLRFRPIDKLIGSVASRGMNVVPTIYGSPKWVQSSSALPPIGSKAERAAWQHFLQLLVARYEPGGTFWRSPSSNKLSPYQAEFGASAPVQPISAWQIWNEPNLTKFFKPFKGAPKKYAKLVKISQKAINASDPKAKIVLAGLSGNGKPAPEKFLKKLYKVNKIKPAFDAAALQPYSATIKDLKSDLKRARKAMKKGHDRRTPLWITELGWGSKHPSSRWPLNKGLNGQKKLLKNSFKFMIKSRKKMHIERVFWYTWRDPAEGENPGGCSFCTSSGLLKNDRTPKPAYKAYAKLTP